MKWIELIAGVTAVSFSALTYTAEAAGGRTRGGRLRFKDRAEQAPLLQFGDAELIRYLREAREAPTAEPGISLVTLPKSGPGRVDVERHRIAYETEHSPTSPMKPVDRILEHLLALKDPRIEAMASGEREFLAATLLSKDYLNLSTALVISALDAQKAHVFDGLEHVRYESRSWNPASEFKVILEEYPFYSFLLQARDPEPLLMDLSSPQLLGVPASELVSRFARQATARYPQKESDAVRTVEFDDLILPLQMLSRESLPDLALLKELILRRLVAAIDPVALESRWAVVDLTGFQLSATAAEKLQAKLKNETLSGSFQSDGFYGLIRHPHELGRLAELLAEGVIARKDYAQ